MGNCSNGCCKLLYDCMSEVKMYHCTDTRPPLAAPPQPRLPENVTQVQGAADAVVCLFIYWFFPHIYSVRLCVYGS